MDDGLSTLPDDLLALILSKIPIREAVRCSLLSTKWRYIHTRIPQPDKLSTLPNSILFLILCKIPIREAIRCSILSKRWKSVYTHISQLNLSPLLLLGRDVYDPSPFSMLRVENIISSILRWSSCDLKAFHLSNRNRVNGRFRVKWQFSNESLSKWFRYAADRNVQCITLCNTQIRGVSFPTALFSCTRLTTLKLCSYVLFNVPTHFSGFNHLISCSFIDMKFTDKSLSRFISHCPLLQNLIISGLCAGLRKPVISAVNITHLIVEQLSAPIEVLTINCPKLITLDVFIVNDLRVNGVLFHNLSKGIFKLEMQEGSILNGLGLAFMEECNFSAETFLEMVGSFKSLKKLAITLWNDLERENEEMVVPLYNLLERFPNLELLHMGGIFALELARDQIPPCLSSTMANLRIVHVDTLTFDDEEIAVLGCLLQSSPALQIMEFRPPQPHIETPTYMRFSENLFSLKRASTQVSICEGDIYERLITGFSSMEHCFHGEELQRR